VLPKRLSHIDDRRQEHRLLARGRIVVRGLGAFVNLFAVRPSKRRIRSAGHVCLAAALAASIATVSCRSSPAGRADVIGGATMGSTWSVALVRGAGEPTDPEVDEIRQAIEDDLARVNALLSTWDEESELSRFNRSTSVEPFAVAPETFDVLRWAQTITGQTGGAFDITVGPLVDAWGFGARDDPDASPSEDEIARLREATGMHHLELDPDGRWVRKRRPDIRCDVSAIVPGYAADRIAALLGRRGFTNVLVDVGGELVARGRNERGVPWRVAVERPDGSAGRPVERVVGLRDAAVATSGDYRNYREIDGRRVPHILDPRTGRPVEHGLASVTVIDTLGVRADALATALMVLGPDEGLALAEALDVAALLLVRREGGGFDARASRRFAALTGETQEK
jgi:thiamine biosynthesis lipoprotein